MDLKNLVEQRQTIDTSLTKHLQDNKNQYIENTKNIYPSSANHETRDTNEINVKS